MASHKSMKSEHELAVFLEFARAADLPGDHTVAEVREPPEPDIFYGGTSPPCYFELGRLADANHAKFMLEVRCRSPEPLAPDLSNVGYPQRDMLLRKIAKTYETGEVPVHLILYFDNESPHTEGPIPPVPFSVEAAHVIEPILRKSMGPFTKVWYFERYRQSVLWRYSQK